MLLYVIAHANKLGMFNQWTKEGTWGYATVLRIRHR